MTGSDFVPSPAESIDQVLDQLARIIEWSRRAYSRLGYFASLYRKVTASVAEGVRKGQFDDAARMERLDVIFANRYLEAARDYRTGKTPTRSWQFAFECGDQYWPIVIQHLLLGMNAHINLDLGIAAAEAMRGEPLESLRDDFNRINGVLASLVDGVQEELGEVWFVLRLLNPFLGRADDKIVNFSMERARDEAWRSATRLSRLPESEWPSAIDGQDRTTRRIGEIVRSPGAYLGFVTKIVRVGEVSSVARVIDILG
jgi:hypothetical protein